MELLFWTIFGVVLYTYLGYPLVIALLASTRKEVVTDSDVEDVGLPEISIVIAALNEADNLQKKIYSINSSDYPVDLIRIIVVSDGSDDDTEQRMAQYPNVTCLVNKERMGKPSALNRGMEVVKTHIVVFSDARQTLKEDALRKLVIALQNENTGAVSGELVQLKALSNEGASVGLYWKYEKWIRRNESRVHSVPGVSGALYAIRSKDYVPLLPDTILDDFEIPLNILKKGKKVKFESGAIMYDRVEESSGKEKQRKIRTLSGNYQSFARNPWLFNPLSNPIWFQFMSHKFLRLTVPYCMFLLLVLPPFLPGAFYTLFFISEGGFYLLVFMARLFPELKNNRLVGFCHVFWDLNMSAVIALKRYLFGDVNVKWVRT